MDAISETQAALKETMDNESRRLANARQLREFLRKQLEAGITPNHYRIDFLRRGSEAVIETLSDVAEEFNHDYPLDKVTAMDLIDILNTTIAKIAASTRVIGTDL
jgi:hypothetical protein